ncbi:MAG: DNA polymerase V [Psychrobacter glaciei]|jgi:DNA polymerase V
MKLLTVYIDSVPCGFPSPADDYSEEQLSLDEHLIKHPSATFLARASGDSMQGRGIFDRDMLIIDRALEPVHGDIVVVAIDGQLTCKSIDLHRKLLLAANPLYPPIQITEDQDVVIEGVVKASIRYHRVG